MSLGLSIEVLGVPSPKGSKTRMPNGAMLDGKSPEARARLETWHASVANCARNAWGGEAPLDCPIHIAITFRLPMPKSRPKATRAAGVGWHTTKPDIDKLLRSTLDALTDAGVIRDDARVCHLSAQAIEVIGWTGAHITVTDLDLVSPEGAS